MLTFLSDTPARLRDERGGVAVLFALMVPTLLLAFAIATDVGNWFVHRRHLQMQVDAAALAGGALFGNCFSTDAGTVSAANTAIENEAGKYAGLSSSPYNIQVGGGSSNVTVAYNSQTYPGGGSGGPAADDTETNPPCQTPHLMLDVKETERHVPYLLGGVLSNAGLLPEAQIYARARVQLKKIQILAGELPLAVPDVNPAHVAVTFVNEAGAANNSLGMYPLTKGTPANGLNMWSGSAAVTMPTLAGGSTGQLIGMRVSVGGVNGTCGLGVQGGTGFACYDWSNGTGLVGVRDYPTSPAGTLKAPVIKGVWGVSRAACSLGSSSPFFSDVTLAGAASCPMDLFVDVDAGANYANGTLTATINGVTRTMVAPATATGDWTSPGAQPFSIPASAGPFSVDLNWNCPSGCPSKGIAFTGVQRVYSGDDTDSGPVKTIDVAEGSSRTYSAAAGAHTFTVTVGLKGSLNLSTSAQTVALRLTGGSRTTAIDCDATGASAWRAAIINGCQTPYQINASDVCPDPNPPSGPADCVPVETGKMANSAADALNTRFAACPVNNWPAFTDDDPRIVQLMVTDFSALDGSGKTTIPVQDFAAFYVTGWDGANCGNNQAWPFAGSSDKGDIWGHFIKYVEPNPNGVATDVCDPNGLTPCIPVLVK